MISSRTAWEAAPVAVPSSPPKHCRGSCARLRAVLFLRFGFRGGWVVAHTSEARAVGFTLVLIYSLVLGSFELHSPLPTYHTTWLTYQEDVTPSGVRPMEEALLLPATSCAVPCRPQVIAAGSRQAVARGQKSSLTRDLWPVEYSFSLYCAHQGHPWLW